ncbi:MAG: hypothetical protein U1F49_05855 [Rubrivivax sp.]
MTKPDVAVAAAGVGAAAAADAPAPATAAATASSPSPPPGADATVMRLPREPYPGLRPFLDFEAALLFGRQRQVGEILERLAATQFVAVLGGSGSGKSRSSTPASRRPCAATAFPAPATCGCRWCARRAPTSAPPTRRRGAIRR